LTAINQSILSALRRRRTQRAPAQRQLARLLPVLSAPNACASGCPDMRWRRSLPGNADNYQRSHAPLNVAIATASMSSHRTAQRNGSSGH